MPSPGRRQPAACLALPSASFINQPWSWAWVMARLPMAKRSDHLVVADAEGMAQAAQNIVVGHVDSLWKRRRCYHLPPVQSEKAPQSVRGQVAGASCLTCSRASRSSSNFGFQIAHGDPVAQLLLELGEQALQTRHPGVGAATVEAVELGQHVWASSALFQRRRQDGLHLVEAGQQHGQHLPGEGWLAGGLTHGEGQPIC